ncbi:MULTISPECIES: glycosyltransferase family 39 protein [Comamonas]|jgi:4-amino-4-deoxy-L-arabinose transferase-like glycosyltransferase|uniref:glycosyltransferase family 39 protein n=1 Tax=Comamonas TaxID=283 RepID=UPI0012BDBD16|nr:MULTISPECIES: glycosyltransferase family 39 protein [Comamonas]MDR3065372.1 glycosyltransferase family 39 protein [Comamonas sp.]MEB5966726.1 glycosyltransferase family 39 protein [Comamonas testosteroni]MPS93865.1 glycosyltransferase family 39 protein [Comamonas sp.]
MTAVQRESLVLGGRAVAALLAVYGVVWLAIHWVTALAAPGDNVEQLIWIRSLELGYFKHPPMPTWIMAASAAVVGPSIGLTYVLGGVLTLGSLAIFWKLLCDMRGRAYATVGLLAALSITFYCGRLYYYNHNVVMMLWISMAVALTWQITQKPSLAGWAGLGLVSGLGMLSKYQYVLALGVIGLWWLRIGAWKNPVHVKGAALAAVVGLLVLSPHLYWLTSHDWMPMHYAERTSLGLHLDTAARIKMSWTFAVDWIFNRCMPAWIVLGVALWWGRRRAGKTGAQTAPVKELPVDADRMLREFWLLWGLVPLLAMLVLCLFTGSYLHLQWGTAFMFLCVPAVMEWARSPRSWGAAGDLRAAWLTFGILQALLLLQFWLASPMGLSGYKSSHQNHIPVDRIVAGLAPAAHQALGGPVDIIIGPQALAGRIAMELPERPRVYVERNLQYSPWIREEELPNARIIEVLVAADPLPEGVTRAYGVWAWRPVKIAKGEH